jgi:hypothetical protein
MIHPNDTPITRRVDLDDDDEAAAREEYEAMAEDIFYARALGPCGR